MKRQSKTKKRQRKKTWQPPAYPIIDTKGVILSIKIFLHRLFPASTPKSTLTTIKALICGLPQLVGERLCVREPIPRTFIVESNEAN